MEREMIRKQMKEMLGAEHVITDEKVLTRESIDYVGYRNWERYNKRYNAEQPVCITKPQNVSEVAKVLKYLNKEGIVAIPKTGGSSATAGVEVITPNTVIVDGSDMNKIVELSEEDMYVTVQCGVALEYLEAYLNKKGYTTGHMPQSLPMAQMGGLVSTRSTGQFSTMYGGIEELVVGLETVLADGSVVRIKNVPRRAAGPDLRHLVIGNEGALSYITEVTVKIFHYAPADRFKMGYAVKDMSTGLKILHEIMVNGYKPAVARLHDAYEAQADYSAFAKEGECVLLFLAEGAKDLTKVTGEAIQRICDQFGACTLGDKIIDVWLKHRNDLCDEMDALPAYKKNCVAETCEISALWSRIEGVYDRVLERIKDEVDSIVYICGHSSHSYEQGTNIYFKFGFQAFETDEETRAEYFHILGIILEETLKVDGSIAHHHGIGKYRAKWSEEEHGSSYVMLEMLKKTFDPNGIMNKGTLLPSK